MPVLRNLDMEMKSFKPVLNGLPAGPIYTSGTIAAFELRAEKSCDLCIPASDHHLLMFRTRHRSVVRCEVAGRTISGDTMPGEFSLVPEQSTSRWQLTGPQDTVCLLLHSSAISAAASGAGLPGSALELRRASFTADPVLHQLALWLFGELHRSDLGEVSAEALGRLLAVQLIRRYSGACTDDEAPAGLPLHRLRTVLDFISEHYAENLELLELSSLVKMTPFYFLRLFKQSTGKTPHQYLLNYRIEKAKLLLASDDAGLADISLALGFSNQSHFGTTFRKLTGTTPKQYRLHCFNEQKLAFTSSVGRASHC